MDSNLKDFIENSLNKQLQTKSNFNWKAIGGGSINNTYQVLSNTHLFFVKVNTTTVFENGFKEEVLGLQFLNKHKALIPNIILDGTFQNQAYLVLEWIESKKETPKFWENFAMQLVNLHQQKSDKFGLDYANFMGQLSQKNTYFNKFSDFYIENRLKPQVKLAFDSNKIEKKHLKQFEGLYTKIPQIFPVEKPSAIHGDLWNGNFICSESEKAVFIDPAVYYGHREVDIAMTQLFGGFSEKFYKTYNEIYPLEPCFNLRNNFYHLYPLLIHLNTFGKSYLESIENIITEF
ncbi:fructosamine kinase family protein [Lutibacter sp. TH_r2]|uniref:fructosamine kinase family protein n=1 Tax=Lutibacter sp. TH_r2 TaxID=3082083 RepID=UPI002952EC6A|nr:fructosamine kinase family protein [Lutibacter sp. TH_r2]MDV7186583.1 fructosamine kinase family protein [Lutibacter sp. TH_r2]